MEQLIANMEFYSHSSVEFTIGRVSHLLRQQISLVLRDSPYDVSPEEYSVLMALSTATKPQSVGKLARLLLRDATTIKRQLDGLVTHQLVAREKDPHDRRSVLSSITLLGRTAVDELAPKLESLRDAVIASTSAVELEAIKPVLLQMQQNLLSIKAKSSTPTRTPNQLLMPPLKKINEDQSTELG